MSEQTPKPGDPVPVEQAQLDKPTITDRGRLIDRPGARVQGPPGDNERFKGTWSYPNGLPPADEAPPADDAA